MSALAPPFYGDGCRNDTVTMPWRSSITVGPWSFSGCMLDGGEEPDGVVVVEAGDGVAEADGGACSEAG